MKTDRLALRPRIFLLRQTKCRWRRTSHISCSFREKIRGLVRAKPSENQRPFPKTQHQARRRVNQDQAGAPQIVPPPPPLPHARAAAGSMRVGALAWEQHRRRLEPAAAEGGAGLKHPAMPMATLVMPLLPCGGAAGSTGFEEAPPGGKRLRETRSRTAPPHRFRLSMSCQGGR